MLPQGVPAGDTGAVLSDAPPMLSPDTPVFFYGIGAMLFPATGAVLSDDTGLPKVNW